MSVRAKPVVEPKRRRVWLPIAGLVLLGAVCAAGFGIYKYGGHLKLIQPDIEIVANGAARIIRVPAGGDLQAAVDKAESGDIIELQAGATYAGEIKLPNKPLTDFVTIRSSEAEKLPTDVRVKPDQAGLMAKIVTKGGGKPAISAAHGANHYRFVGIEFTPTSADYIYNLVLFGSDETKPEDLPHDLEIDRSYLHPYKTGKVRRGIALNSADTVIKNSYIEGFGFDGEEAQGICGWTGTRNVKILNNYIEGGAENILIGGADIDSASLIPTGIEIRGNYLNKPESWKGKVSLKTLFEIKNAKNVRFTGNYMTNNWLGAAFRITVRNQDGKSPYSTIEDVVIKENVLDGAGDGINILGSDNNYPSGTLKNLEITNNLMLNIGGKAWDGSGFFIQVSDGENILIANNTSINNGNIATLYGTMPRSLVVRDNIVGHGNYGIHGPVDLNSAAARSMFHDNVFMNLNGVPSGDYAFPAGNTMVSGIGDIGFANPTANDYRLSPKSKFIGKGSSIFVKF